MVGRIKDVDWEDLTTPLLLLVSVLLVVNVIFTAYVMKKSMKMWYTNKKSDPELCNQVCTQLLGAQQSFVDWQGMCYCGVERNFNGQKVVVYGPIGIITKG